MDYIRQSNTRSWAVHSIYHPLLISFIDIAKIINLIDELLIY